MANFFLLLTIIPNHLLFSATAQPPSSSPTTTPSPSPTTFPPPPSSPPPITPLTPSPPPPSSLPPPPPPPPTTTINTPTQQTQLDNIIDALIGAGDFAGWANILSNTNPSNLPLSATFFIPGGNSALSHLPPSTASGSLNFDPLIIAYHIIPQRLSFSDLLLFKPQTRLPTLLPTKSILITNNSPSNFTLDNSTITHPDMYINSEVSVHGIGTILDYTVYGGNPFQPPVQQAQQPPSEVANNRRSDSATMMFADYHLVFAIICAVFAFNIEIGRLNRAKIALFLCGLYFLATAHGVSEDSLDGSCLIAYAKGGAPAIFKSTKCSHWVESVNSYKSHGGKCDSATRQGHRPYQEDYMTCNLGLKIPVLGRDGLKEAKVDVLAIFDGHVGAEASKMAKQKLLDYFILHVLFRAVNKAEITVDQHDLNPTSPEMVLSVITDDESSHNNLKEALLHAIHDIDMEFLEEAYKNRYFGGSTATVVVLLNDEEILVASLGDSPALLCTGSWTRKLRAEKLTRNHYPDEEDERARLEAAGGYVQVMGLRRVNGRLALSRAIGDISLKRFGVIAEPEVKGWRKLTRKDGYLVIASGGIFNGGLTPDDVCKIIEQGRTSFSESIVMAALKKGSMDNLSAIVLPLRQPTRSNSRSQPSKDEL